MTRPKQMTKAERVAWGHAVDAMRRLEWDTHASLIATGQLPDGWDEIWNHRAPRDTSRQKVTIRLDSDVVKFFRAMGEGYQPRINAVLRAFMYFRLAGVVEGPESGDYAARFVREGTQPEPEEVVDYDALREEIGRRLDKLREQRGWG